MSKVILPNRNQTGPNEWADVEGNDNAIVEVVNGDLDNDNLSGDAGITRANLDAGAKPTRWYEPVIIAATQTRTNSSFGLLGTPDEVPDVVVPEGGLIVVRYLALIRESNGSGEMHAALFLNSTQLRTGTNTGDEVNTSQASPWQAMATSGRTDTESGGLTIVGSNGSEETPAIGILGATEIFAPAGTYDVSVKYRSTGGGTAAVKMRRLYVEVKGAKE